MRFWVRPLRPEDLPAYLALCLALWPEGGDDLKEVEGLLQDLDQAAFGAEVEGQRWASWRLPCAPTPRDATPAPGGYLEGGYVAPKWRGQGIGRALMEAAEAWARARGYREVASDAELSNLPSTRTQRLLHRPKPKRLANGLFRAPVVAQATTGYLGQEVHRRLGYQEVERIVCFRKNL